MEALGIDSGVVRAHASWNDQLVFRFVLNGAVGRAVWRGRGIPQGDPWSMLKLNALYAPFAWKLAATCQVRFWPLQGARVGRLLRI